MKKIHITLIGGQKMPIFKGIITSVPDYTYLLHTKGSRRDAEFIKSLLDHEAELVEIDEFDIPAIHAKIRERVTEKGKLIVNTTGALKSMSFALYQYFEKDPDATVFYMDQADRYIDLKTHQKELKQIPIPIDSICTLMNHEVGDVVLWREVDEDLQNAARQMRNFATSFPSPFYSLSRDFRLLKEPRNAHQKMLKSGESSIIYDHIKTKLTIKMKGPKKQDAFELIHPRAFDLIGRTLWLEVEVAEMVSNLQGLDEMMLGLVFNYTASEETKDRPKNELDLVLRIKNRIVVIEVKSNIFDIKDIDKFKSAVRYYFGDAATPIFLTDAQVPINQKEKLEDAGLTHICLSELRRRHPNDTYVALHHAIYDAMVTNHMR